MRIGAAILGVALLYLCGSGCGKKKHVPRSSVAPVPSSAPALASESGLASWYGHPYHGRRAANGEIYDMEQMTAAHRTLPFGTWVRVRNMENNKTVDVRITDRGPFVGGRILDLSHAAAVSINMIGPGTAKIKLTVIRGGGGGSGAGASPAKVSSGEPPAPPALYAVQVGAFTDRRNADRIQSSMQRRYGSATTVKRDGRP